MSRGKSISVYFSGFLGFILTLACFRPGFMSFDSVVQLAQARSGSYDDWHPPVMAWVWRFWDLLIPGQFGMLIFHAAMFWAGATIVFVVCKPFRNPLFNALATLGSGLIPPVFALLSTIWKDVGMAASLLLAFSLLLLADRKRSRLALWGSLPFLSYGFSVRHNGAIACFPLTLWLGGIFRGWVSRSHGRGMGLAAGVLLFAGLIVASHELNHLLVRDKPSLFPARQILVFDLLGVSVRSGELLLPKDLLPPEATLQEVGRQYRLEGAPGTPVDPSLRPFRYASDPIAVRTLWGAWLRAVWRHPFFYFQHRVAVFREEFAIGTKDVFYPYHIGPLRQGSSLQSWALRYFKGASRSFWFRGWIYLVILPFFFLEAFFSKRGPLVAVSVLSASGFMYGASLFMIGTGADFRLHWWTVVSAIFVIPVRFRSRLI